MSILSYDDIISSLDPVPNKDYTLITQDGLVDLVDTLYFADRGATGMTGPAGAYIGEYADRIYAGYGPPIGVTGVTGDVYFSNNGDVYKHDDFSWGSPTINMLKSQSGPFSFRYVYDSGNIAPFNGFSFGFTDVAVNVSDIYIPFPDATNTLRFGWLSGMLIPGNIVDVRNINDPSKHVTMTVAFVDDAGFGRHATLINAYNNTGIFEDGDLCEITIRLDTDSDGSMYIGWPLPAFSSFSDGNIAYLRDATLYTNSNSASWISNFGVYDTDAIDNGSIWNVLAVGAPISFGGVTINSTTLSDISTVTLHVVSARTHNFTDFFATVIPGMRLSIRQRGAPNGVYIGLIDQITTVFGSVTFNCTPIATNFGAINFPVATIAFN